MHPKKKTGFTGPVADNDRTMSMKKPGFTGPVADNDRPMAAEIPDEGIEAAVEEQDAQVAAGRQAAVGQGAPVAESPLSPERVNVLGQTIVDAIEGLTGQQVTAMPEQIDGEVEQMPAKLFTQLAAMHAILEQAPGGEKYRFDIEAAAASNEGIADAIAAIGQAGRDKTLRRSLTMAAEPAKKESPEPAPDAEPDDMDDYM